MVLKKLKVGMLVYDVREAKGLHRFNVRWQSWSVVINQIDEENEMFSVNVNDSSVTCCVWER